MTRSDDVGVRICSHLCFVGITTSQAKINPTTKKPQQELRSHAERAKEVHKKVDATMIHAYKHNFDEAEWSADMTATEQEAETKKRMHEQTLAQHK